MQFLPFLVIPKGYSENNMLVVPLQDLGEYSLKLYMPKGGLAIVVGFFVFKMYEVYTPHYAWHCYINTNHISFA